MKYSITFEVYTPESIEFGEPEETGFICEDIEADSLKEMVLYMLKEGFTSPSSSDFHPGIWYSWPENQIDYQSGEEEIQSLHLSDLTERQAKWIYNAIMKRS